MVNVAGYVTAISPTNMIKIDGTEYGASIDVQKFIRSYKVGDAVYASHLNGTISFLQKYDAWAARYPDRAAKLPLPAQTVAPVAQATTVVNNSTAASGGWRVNEERLMGSAVSCATGIVKSLIEAKVLVTVDDTNVENIRAIMNYLTHSIFNDQYEILTGEARE